MELSGQLYFLATLLLGREQSLSFGLEAGWATGPV